MCVYVCVIIVAHLAHYFICRRSWHFQRRADWTATGWTDFGRSDDCCRCYQETSRIRGTLPDLTASLWIYWVGWNCTNEYKWQSIVLGPHDKGPRMGNTSLEHCINALAVSRWHVQLSSLSFVYSLSCWLEPPCCFDRVCHDILSMYKNFQAFSTVSDDGHKDQRSITVTLRRNIHLES